MSKPLLARLAGIYLRTGNTTFGGGDPTMAALQNELVVRRGWLSHDRYGLVFALARVTPGTNILAFVAGSAWEIAGWRAAVLGVLAATVPCAVLAVLLAAGFAALQTSPRAMAAIAGTLAAAVGLMVTGAWQLLARHFQGGNRRRAVQAIVFAAAGFVLAAYCHFSPIAVLALAAAGGALLPPSPRP